ncbi:MAG: hypothetical protein WCS65_03195 [Verrucomicrobiae bacterium]
MSRILTLAVFFLAIPALHSAPPSAEFSIAGDVRVSNPPRFGINFNPSVPNHWSGGGSVNQWNCLSSFEPARNRHFDYATSGGADWFVNDGQAGMSFYDVWGDGYWAGADVRIYRLADGKWNLLRTGKVKEFLAGKKGASPNKITLESSGPEIKEGDFYHLDLTLADWSGRKKEDRYAGISSYPFDLVVPGQEPGKKLTLMEKLAAVQPTYLDSTFAPEGGSRGSLKMEGKVPGRFGLARWGFGGKTEQERFWTKFPLGSPTFRFSVWLKQEGIADGKVALEMGDVKTEFSVAGEWKNFTYDFPATTADKLPQIKLTANGPGSFWVDNFLLYDPSKEPFAWEPREIEAIKEFAPGVIRWWSGLNQGAGIRGGNSLENWLQPWLGSGDFVTETERAMPAYPPLPNLLALTRQVGSNPWLIISPVFTAEEYSNLIEYLAGPTNSKYGALRAKHGQEKPWTEVFDRILIECGNEQWNRMFKPLEFSGRPLLYGAWADIGFEAVKASPYYKPEKFELVVSGFSVNAHGWNDKTLSATRQADAIGIAGYNGGGADTASVGGEGDSLLMNRMFYNERVTFLDTEKLLASLSKDGKNRKPLVYEAGPGYDLPDPGRPYGLEEERRGKSLAAAIGTLQIFLDREGKGFRDQAFFGWCPGPNWSSHSDLLNKFPHTTTLALQMHNSLCPGDLVKVDALGGPTNNLPENVTKQRKQIKTSDIAKKEAELKASGKAEDEVAVEMDKFLYDTQKFPAVPAVPTVTAHAYRQGRKLSILLLSRELKDPVEVKLNLPFDPKPAATLHRLSADDPWANNIDDYKVRVSVEPAPSVARTTTLSLPPHSVSVLQVEEQ